MNLFEKANIINYHRHRIAEFGDGTKKALGWKRGLSQQKRFGVLSTLDNFDGCTILDAGCGYGDLKKYLDGKFSGFSYIGIDHMPEFIERAKSQYFGCRDTCFFQADFITSILPKVDYVLASGVFAYRCDNANFYCEMITKMYATARNAIAFNMLNADYFNETPLLVGQSIEKVFEFCRSISPDVKLVQGYLKDDFTIFMYKGK